MFDTQYQPTQTIRFQLNDAGYHETLIALQDATGSFLTPVSERLIFVANDLIKSALNSKGMSP